MNIIQDEDHRKLLPRPIEQDTQTLSTRFQQIKGIPFVIEKWRWEAITGSSAVFLNENVTGMGDAALQDFLMEDAGIDLEGCVTVSRTDTHTLLNYGFAAK